MEGGRVGRVTVVVACCLAVVLVGHTSEAVGSHAGGEVVMLGQAESGDDTDVGAKLQALGKVIKATPTRQVRAALERGFTSNVWQSWEREATAQKLDAEGSLAVLNSYLTANVNNGNKVMHVVSWVKKALKSRKGDPQRLKLTEKVSELQQRVHDTGMLAKQSNTAAAAQLADRMKGDLAEAQGDLSKYDDAKLQELKKTAADKKDKAAALEQKQAKEKGSADDAGAEAADAASATDASEKSDEKKGDEKAEEEKDAAAKPVTPIDMEKAKEVDKKKWDKSMAAEATQKAKAKKLRVKSTELSQKSQAAQAEAGVARKKAESGDQDSPKEQMQLMNRARIAARKAASLRDAVETALRKADTAEEASDLRLFSYRKNVLTEAKEARMKNEQLLTSEKEAFKKETSNQEKLVREKVQAAEKIRIAEDTVKHAKVTKDTDLVAKAGALLMKAKHHETKVDNEVEESGNKLEKSAALLQKTAKNQAQEVAEDFKMEIHQAIKDARKMRQKARLMIKAHKIQQNVALKAAKASGGHANAAYGASLKAKRKASINLKKADHLDDMSSYIQKKTEPIEMEIHEFSTKLKSAQEELSLARQSEQFQAINMATVKYTQAKAGLHSAEAKLKALGKTPEQLNVEADQLRDSATHEEDIESAANKAVDQYQKSQQASMEAAEEAAKEKDSVKKFFLPKVLRHTHRRVAFIEHALAKELASLKKLGQIKPTKAVAEEEQAKQEKLREELANEKNAAKLKIVALKKLRMKVNGLRKDAESALTHAKKVEEQTQAADKEIATLKAKACTKAKLLAEQLGNAKKAKQNIEKLEVEVSRAEEACQKADQDLAAAREELSKRAKDVSDAASKAKNLEAQYAKEDETVAANEADKATEEAVVEKQHSAEDKEKLSALKAMIKEAMGKEAEAKMMVKAAEKSKDTDQKETATAALAAAQHHLAKLRLEKEAINNQMKSAKKELGELHSSIRSDAVEIQHEESDHEHVEAELGAVQNEAAGEAASSQMMHKVNALTVQLAKEKQVRQDEEAARRDQDVSVRAEMEKMKVRLDSVDRAAAAIIEELETAVKKGKSHTMTDDERKAEAGKLQKDEKIAEDQEDKLKTLSKTAEDKVKAAQADVAAAGGNATAAQSAKLTQAQNDLGAVTNATKKVQDREATDKQKLVTLGDGATGNKVVDEAIGGFAEKLKAKFNQLKSSTEQALNRDTGIEKQEWSKETSANAKDEKVLQDRITGLEAAVAQLGGNVQEVEGAGKGKGATKIEQEIRDEKQKLENIETKIGALDGQYEKAEKKNDTQAQIQTGTAQKDLEHEAKNIKDKLQGLYKDLEGKQKVGTGAAPAAASGANATMRANVTAVVKHENQLVKVVQSARAATEHRQELLKKEEDARAQLQQAMNDEHEKLDKAHTAKQSLKVELSNLKKQEADQEARAKAEKEQLNMQHSQLMTEEGKAEEKRQQINEKLEEVTATISNLTQATAAGPGVPCLNGTENDTSTVLKDLAKPVLLL